MKRILITGKNSYVGNSFAEFLLKYPDDYKVDKISLRDDAWKDMDFSVYDVILHVAGIAHVKETKANKNLYYKVNRDLTIEVATKAKREKIQQFIFLSSMSVFGLSQGAIDKNTTTIPKTAYGKSKLQAEAGLKELEDGNFIISILRPPMIYGPNSKGNYPKLAKLAKITPIFPDYPNIRSMLFIDNLSMFIKELININKSGLFLPHNTEYINTSEMVKHIANFNDNKIYLIKILNPVIEMFMKNSLINKVFGNLYFKEGDNLTNFIKFEKSIKKSEGYCE